jgi:hypothetical protein
VAEVITAETRQKPKTFLKLSPDQPFVHFGETISKADFKNNPKTH